MKLRIGLCVSLFVAIAVCALGSATSALAIDTAQAQRAANQARIKVIVAKAEYADTAQRIQALIGQLSNQNANSLIARQFSVLAADIYKQRWNASGYSLPEPALRFDEARPISAMAAALGVVVPRYVEEQAGINRHGLNVIVNRLTEFIEGSGGQLSQLHQTANDRFCELGEALAEFLQARDALATAKSTASTPSAQPIGAQRPSATPSAQPIGAQTPTATPITQPIGLQQTTATLSRTQQVAKAKSTAKPAAPVIRRVRLTSHKFKKNRPAAVKFHLAMTPTKAQAKVELRIIRIGKRFGKNGKLFGVIRGLKGRHGDRNSFVLRKVRLGKQLKNLRPGTYRLVIHVAGPNNVTARPSSAIFTVI